MSLTAIKDNPCLEILPSFDFYCLITSHFSSMFAIVCYLCCTFFLFLINLDLSQRTGSTAPTLLFAFHYFHISNTSIFAVIPSWISNPDCSPGLLVPWLFFFFLILGCQTINKIPPKKISLFFSYRCAPHTKIPFFKILYLSDNFSSLLYRLIF